jgi:hypothetical protein
MYTALREERREGKRKNKIEVKKNNMKIIIESRDGY